MSEPTPEYDDGRPAEAEAAPWAEITITAVNQDYAADDPACVALWRRAVVSAVADLARSNSIRPGDRLDVAGRVKLTGSRAQATARVEVIAGGEGAAAGHWAAWGRPPYRCPVCGWANEAQMTRENGTETAAAPPCGCDTCRMLAEVWDNPADAEYDNR